MITGTRTYTVEEFDEFVTLPENADRLFEYVGGEIVEVVSNNFSSLVAARILGRVIVYVESRDLGYVTGADGGYTVSGERYIPDVAFISKARQPQPSHDVYNAQPPDLAVEVLSPSDQPGGMRIKLTNYLAAGTTVWVVDPEARVIEIHTPGQRAQKIGAEGTLDGGAVLPGFALAAAEIFRE